MAYIFISGFEGGAAGSDGFTSSASATITWDSTVKRSGTYSLKALFVAGTGYVPFNYFASASADTYVRLYLYIQSGNTTSFVSFWSGSGGTTGVARVKINSAMKLEFYDSVPTLIATGTTVLSTATQYRIEVRVKPATSTTGIWEVKIDGASEISGTTENLGTASTSEVDLGETSNAATATYNIDDFAINNSEYPGAGAVAALIPNGAGNLTEFDTTAGSATHWENVDETPLSDTDYNQHAGASIATDLYAVTDSASASPVITSGDTIHTVLAIWRMKRGTGAGGVHQYSIREDATQTNTTITLGTGFTTNIKIYDTAPNSGGAWTTTKLDSLEIGAKHSDTGAQDQFISYARFMVDFVTPPPPPPPGGTLLKDPIGRGVVPWKR